MRTLEERLASYRAAFLEKVKHTNWDDEGDTPRCKRGRKAQVKVRIESKPRTPGERKIVQQKYNWL
jgi:hypothetical protein